ncbi:MAG: Rieske (2Fe-2S) protein [Actinomycetota bacterium]
MSQDTSTIQAATSTTETVGTVDDFPQGGMKLATVGGRRVAVIRTPSGLHALDNACPHQGYGLVTGALDGELVTCQWHNWKFDVRDGSCVMGEEGVACHQVTVTDDDTVQVTVVEPTIEERREALWPSFRKGMKRQYNGQIARDTARLLEAEATPAEIMGDAVAYGAPRNEWGIGHEMAMATDCLAWSEITTGSEQALPLIQGLSGIAETTRDRRVREVPSPDADADFLAAIEGEDTDIAMAAVLGSIERGDDPSVLRDLFITAASTHHLDYGHGMIYVQKAFEMLERIGWDRAPDLLPHLAISIGWGTREDLLPYMRKAMRKIEAVDLDALAVAEDRRTTGWWDDAFVDTMLTSEEAAIDEAVRAVQDGAGVAGLLDAVTVGASKRLLRHDLDVEFDLSNDFGWLDITHALTLSNAVRWAWNAAPGPDTARAALFAAWLLFDSGRAERRFGITEIEPETTGSSTEDFTKAVRMGRVDEALGWVHGAGIATATGALRDAALADQSGSFIVTAHVIKLAHAAAEEAAVLADTAPDIAHAPLLATTRFVAAPRLERFVTRNVNESLEFLRTGAPPKR